MPVSFVNAGIVVMLGKKTHATNVPALAHALIGLCFVTLSSIPALSAGNPVAGQQDFTARCAMCHATTGGENKIGPSLASVVGNSSGSAAGFNYSAALKSANLTWDEATLEKWLQNPSGLVHGTSMFVNLPNSTDRQNVIAYLKTLSTNQTTLHSATQ
jgi:cytochrome c